MEVYILNGKSEVFVDDFMLYVDDHKFGRVEFMIRIRFITFFMI
jgi:hypothetical protein